MSIKPVNRVFIRGDTHGNFDWLPDFCAQNQTTTRDILIILGDSALRFEGAANKREVARKTFVSHQAITIFALRGNHDRPYVGKDGADIELIDCPLLEEDHDTKMWHDKNYPNIWYFKDGGDYKIKDKTFFTYGGAYSVDKEYRLLMHWTWYPNEVVDHKTHCECLDTVDHRFFNYVLTHTCPMEWRPTHLFMGGIDQSKVDTTMEQYLSEVLQYIGGYEHWWFGHYHANEDYGKNTEFPWNGEATMLFDEIRFLF